MKKEWHAGYETDLEAEATQSHARLALTSFKQASIALNGNVGSEMDEVKYQSHIRQCRMDSCSRFSDTNEGRSGRVQFNAPTKTRLI